MQNANIYSVHARVQPAIMGPYRESCMTVRMRFPHSGSLRLLKRGLSVWRRTHSSQAEPGFMAAALLDLLTSTRQGAFTMENDEVVIVDQGRRNSKHGR
jgi:hypothetical protein